MFSPFPVPHPRVLHPILLLFASKMMLPPTPTKHPESSFLGHQQSLKGLSTSSPTKAGQGSQSSSVYGLRVGGSISERSQVSGLVDTIVLPLGFPSPSGFSILPLTLPYRNSDQWFTLNA